MGIRYTLRELLREREISERQFAHLTGVREGTLYQICNNNIERLTTTMIGAICKELKVQPGDWIVWEDDVE